MGSRPSPVMELCCPPTPNSKTAPAWRNKLVLHWRCSPWVDWGWPAQPYLGRRSWQRELSMLK